RHREESDRDPLEPDRPAQHLPLLLGQLCDAEAHTHRARTSWERKTSSSLRNAFSPIGTSITSLCVSPTGSRPSAYGRVTPERSAHGVASVRPPTTSCSPPRSRARTSASSEPTVQSTSASRWSANRSTSCASAPETMPPSTRTASPFGEAPTCRILPRTASSVPSGSLGIESAHPERAAQTTRTTASIRPMLRKLGQRPPPLDGVDGAEEPCSRQPQSCCQTGLFR